MSFVVHLKDSYRHFKPILVKAIHTGTNLIAEKRANNEIAQLYTHTHITRKNQHSSLPKGYLIKIGGASIKIVTSQLVSLTKFRWRVG